MSREEFAILLPKLRPYTDYLYFHLMGEPLCHPLLAEFLELAGQHRFISSFSFKKTGTRIIPRPFSTSLIRCLSQHTAP